MIEKKSIVIDANSNEKRLKEEKNELIEIDSKYYETEKKSNEDLDYAKNRLKNEQEKVEIILKNFNSEILQKNIESIEHVKEKITKIKNLINENKLNEAKLLLEESHVVLSLIGQKLKGESDQDELSKIVSKNENIKSLQESYADSFSKNQSIKKESIKRNERIKTIETEIGSWRNLLSNSEKMVKELTDRKNKLLNKLNELEKQPEIQAEKKGKISENLRSSRKRKK